VAITFMKRQKEMKRQEKQREKAERRAQKKLAKRAAKDSPTDDLILVADSEQLDPLSEPPAE
jgi:hypothetical protein